MVMLNMEDDELELELESECFSWHDAYFELELGPHEELDNDEFEFRVSVSAVVPFPAGIFHHHPTTTATTTDAIHLATNHHHHHHHDAASQIIDPTPTPHQSHTTTSTSCRKRRIGGGKMMMMKLLVKLRSIISIRPSGVGVGLGGLRWFGQRICSSDEFQMARRRRRSLSLFGSRSSCPNSPNSMIIPSPAALPHLGHQNSLLQSAIAHCNKSASTFSFSLN